MRASGLQKHKTTPVVTLWLIQHYVESLYVVGNRDRKVWCFALMWNRLIENRHAEHTMNVQFSVLTDIYKGN